ncbi:hypothetical protein F4804DRAFT_235382 [Jackrogersella minutella]|nr:hypothetical protein F4804DRAFT_235382 [Jackrogersella minutella]
MRGLPKATLKLLKKLIPGRGDNNVNPITTVSETERQQDDVVSPKNNTKTKQQRLAPEPPEECPICHDPVGVANPEGIVESWTKLHCGHKFGTHCIQTWLQESINRDQNTNPSCPICRTTAKHPCGHLISPPPFPSINLDWQLPRPPPSPPRHRQHQQVRRRLTRRPGHPLRPPPQEQPKRLAQVVGECRTCAENAEFDARMRRIRERGRQDTGESATSTGSRSAAAIKSIIPGLKRSTNTIRATVVHVGIDPLEERHPRSVFCVAPHVSSRMSRRPTPPPGYSRRLSI